MVSILGIALSFHYTANSVFSAFFAKSKEKILNNGDC
jgi:hypothetical protein